MALVEVDLKTGIVTIEEIVAVEDCGTMINPMIVDGQVAGAIAQGIGSALFEELVYSDDGQLLTGSLMDYLYPSTMEVPPIRIAHLSTPSDVTEGGIKGVARAGRLLPRPRSSTLSPMRWLRSGWSSTGCRSVHRTSGAPCKTLVPIPRKRALLRGGLMERGKISMFSVCSMSGRSGTCSRGNRFAVAGGQTRRSP